MICIVWGPIWGAVTNDIEYLSSLLVWVFQFQKLLTISDASHLKNNVRLNFSASRALLLNRKKSILRKRCLERTQAKVLQQVLVTLGQRMSTGDQRFANIRASKIGQRMSSGTWARTPRSGPTPWLLKETRMRCSSGRKRMMQLGKERRDLSLKTIYVKSQASLNQ